jgi:1-acyl-sn-glycerol-3-phosphate acyltransferase
MAQRYDLPVIPCAISYRKPGKIATFFGRKNPFITLTIGEPLLIDKELSPKEAVNKLRLETHQQIVSMAGIVQNCWQAEGD